jgi:hypothetical protein
MCVLSDTTYVSSYYYICVLRVVVSYNTHLGMCRCVSSHILLCIYICIHTYIHMYIRMCVCVCVCVSVCIHICMCIHIYTTPEGPDIALAGVRLVLARAHTHTHTHTRKTPEGPDIALVVVRLVLAYFRRQVVRCTCR